MWFTNKRKYLHERLVRYWRTAVNRRQPAVREESQLPAPRLLMEPFSYSVIGQNPQNLQYKIGLYVVNVLS